MADTSSALIRRGRPNAQYTAISNNLIDHPTLSPEARLVLMYLLSKPADWQLQVNDLRRVLGTGKKPCGRNKAYEVLTELKSSCYVFAYKQKDKGRFNRIIYYVFDEPLEKPEAFLKELNSTAGQEAKPSTPPQKPPCPQNRETVMRPCPLKPRPLKPYPLKRDTTKERKIQKTDPPPTSQKPKGAVKGGGQDFEKLWTIWPKDSLPHFKEAARNCFHKLKPNEQTGALEVAGDFLRNCQLRKIRPLMIDYLKQRIFKDFLDGPQINSDGRFEVRSNHPEWPLWLKHFSPKARDRVSQQGYLLTETRLPPKPDLATS